jgi:transcriptional regulator with XRE-family HTH domain
MSRTVKGNSLQQIGAGGRLKTAMERRAFDTALLAKSTGLSQATIRHFLHGTREMHLDDLKAIGSALQISPSWIAWGR